MRRLVSTVAESLFYHLNSQLLVSALYMPLLTLRRSNNKRMGLVEMASKTEAIEALIAFHYYQLHDSQIKVSFSRSSIRSD